MSLPYLNRAAIILEPTEAYLAWAKNYPVPVPDLTLADIRSEASVYLIPEQDAAPDAWLKENYLTIFEEELEAWCTEERFWPKNRSYQAFRRYFDIRFGSIVQDACPGRIVRSAE